MGRLRLIRTEVSKQCGTCREVKPFSEYKRNAYNKDGLHKDCRPCVQAYRSKPEVKKQSLDAQRTWRARPENKIKTKTWAKKFRESDYGKEWIVNDGLKRNYGISLPQYNAMFDAQSGRCAICAKHQSELSKRLNVDHDHFFGNVRALLCHHCNTALGALQEDTKRMRLMIDYVEHWNKKGL